MEGSLLEAYIEKQSKLLNLEHKAEEDENAQMLQEQTCHELEKAGYGINNLRLKTSKMGLYGRILLTLNSGLFNASDKSEKDFTEQEKQLFRLPYHRLGCGDTVG